MVSKKDVGGAGFRLTCKQPTRASGLAVLARFACDNQPVEILIARSEGELEQAYQRLSTAKVLGCDTETSGLSPRYGKLFSIQFSDGDFSVLVPLSERVPLGILSDILTDELITKVFHNARFDLEFLREGGYEVNNIFDTMIAEKVLTRGANQSASLAETLYRYFAVDLEKSHRTKFTRNWNGIWTDELVDYALSDVAHLPRLRSEQSAWLEKLGLVDEYHQQISRVFLKGAEIENADKK